VASYLGKPVLRTRDPQMSLRGAARLASRACYSKDEFLEPEFELIEPDYDLKLLSVDDLWRGIRSLRCLGKLNDEH